MNNKDLEDEELTKSKRTKKAERTLVEEKITNQTDYKELLKEKDFISPFIVFFIIILALTMSVLGTVLQLGFDQEQFNKQIGSIISNVVSLILVVVALVVYYTNKIKRTKKKILLEVAMKNMNDRLNEFEKIKNKSEKED